MDDKELKQAKEKLAGLDKALSSLAIKQRTAESKLAGEHELVRKCVSQRTAVVGGLIDADEETAKKLHKQLDSLDSQIRGAERMAESLQHLLKTIASELAEVSTQREKANAVVAQENNTREFAAWCTTMEANFAAASAAMENARLTLGRLTVAAASGIERFAGAAGNFASSRFDEWEHKQANPESLLNFRQALPWFRNVVIHVSPMTRG